MQFSQKTILGLFDSSQKHFVIPVYQRAYSWTKDECGTFLDDLKNQINGDNNYFFGNLLLETIDKDVQYEIIDGQQRLTTLTIFFRSLLDVVSERIEQGEKINLDIVEKEKIYLKNGGNIKLRLVEYDRACFETLIIDGKKTFETFTPSQDRIEKAKDFFCKELKKIDTDTLMKILNKIEKTDLTTIELVGKKDSALMFELENNRGKDLSNMEKLKSYLMYQMYVYSKAEETETNIESISKIFQSIYLVINDLKKLNEDSILLYHCNAYIKGYQYRTIDDIKDVFKKSENKVEWIKKFIIELHTTFANIKKLESSDDIYLTDMNILDIPAFAYAFIIKGYKYFEDDLKKLSNLFHILEIVVFRYWLINSRADIISRLNEILKDFKGDLGLLRNHFKNKLNESWYWGDLRTKEFLNAWMYENRVLHYLLWKYENSIQNRGYTIKKILLENEQIEHISPKYPTNGEPIETGYEVDDENKYSEEFYNNYLNCLGNLMLISGSHNASIGNKPFKEKLNSYKKNPLLNQQAEILKFIPESESTPKWNLPAIKRRHAEILNFAIDNWNFDLLEL